MKGEIHMKDKITQAPSSSDGSLGTNLEDVKRFSTFIQEQGRQWFSITSVRNGIAAGVDGTEQFTTSVRVGGP